MALAGVHEILGRRGEEEVLEDVCEDDTGHEIIDFVSMFVCVFVCVPVGPWIVAQIVCVLAFQNMLHLEEISDVRHHGNLHREIRQSPLESSALAPPSRPQKALPGAQGPYRARRTLALVAKPQTRFRAAVRIQ